MLKFRSIFSIIAFSGGYYGFYFLILIVFIADLGFNIRLFTIPYRAGFLAFSLIFLVYKMIFKHSFARLGPLWIPLLTFWFLYFLQIARDGYLNPVYLGIPPIEYIQKAIGVTFVPMFIFLIRLKYNENKWAFRAFWAMALGSAFLSLFLYRDILGESYRQIHRSIYENISFISPINLGYIGAVVIVIAVQRFFIRYSKKSSRLQTVFLLAFFVLGLVIVILSGTRSAIITSFIICIIVIIINSYKKSSIQRLRILALAIILGAMFLFLMEHLGSSMNARFNILVEQIGTNPDAIGGRRLWIYRNALQQISESPFLGSCLEVKVVNFYPHNHVLESFMATGILGGISFLVLIWAVCKRCLKILQYKKEYGWIACLFLVFFIRGLFSSSIINPMLWYSMLCVLAVPLDHCSSAIFYQA